MDANIEARHKISKERTNKSRASTWKKPRSKQIVYDSNIIRKYYIDKAKKLIKENIRNLLKRDDLISMGSVRVRTLAGEGQT